MGYICAIVVAFILIMWKGILCVVWRACAEQGPLCDGSWAVHCAEPGRCSVTLLRFCSRIGGGNRATIELGAGVVANTGSTVGDSGRSGCGEGRNCCYM